MHEILESRFGKYCIIAYALFALGTYATSTACGDGSCSLAFILPIMPWGYLFTHELRMSFPFVLYPVMMLLNVSLAYILGAVAEYVWRRAKERHLAVPSFLRRTRSAAERQV